MRRTLCPRTNTRGRCLLSVNVMNSREDVEAWLAEQLPLPIETYGVPGAAVAVLAGGEVPRGLTHPATSPYEAILRPPEVG
ncbi:hypothetical protein BH09ACT12_BH09ACT12_21480 [soil metagenome]